MDRFKKKTTVLFLLIFLMINGGLSAQEIRTFMDLQSHATMHMAYDFFRPGLQYFETDKPPKVDHMHQFRNVNYANYWQDNPGARVIINGALCPESIISKKRARTLILRQLNYVNDFVADNSAHFVVARTPQEVRDYVTNTDKTVIIHSIEGAKKLVNSQEDALFWAEQGVAFITLIHLMDDELGGAAIRPGLSTKLINFKGSFMKIFNKERSKGLTEKGRQVIQWLANAGIMIDLSHMSEQTRQDALALMEELEIPPIVTHDLFKPIQNHERGVAPKDILRIYKNGGFMSLPISGITLEAFEAEPFYRQQIDSLECHCPGSVDSYKFTYEALKKHIEESVKTIEGDSTLEFSDLSEQEKVKYSIGFQSDFNGWLNHSRPRYGKEGCFEQKPDQDYEDIELIGMAHPGLLASQWRYLERERVDLEPIKRNAERFLQLWQYFLDNKKN